MTINTNKNIGLQYFVHVGDKFIGSQVYRYQFIVFKFIVI